MTFPISIFVSLCVIFLSIDSFVQAVAHIENKVLAGQIYERAHMETMIACVKCTPSNSIVKLKTVIAKGPINQCLNCFTVKKINPVSDYCVYYVPSQGKLKFSASSAYTITVECTDGASTDTADVFLTLTTNEPPYFTSALSATCLAPLDASITQANTVIFPAIGALDRDKDPIFFSMTTDKVTDVFQIGITDGTIRTKHPMRAYCYPVVVFNVMITDNYNSPVGPVVITCTVVNYYTKPFITNAPRIINAPENATPGTVIYTLTVTPAVPVARHTISTNPASAAGLFSIDKNDLKVAGPLDYEDGVHRNVRIDIQTYNGFCEMEQSYVDVRVTNRNDAPKISPKYVSRTFPENQVISFDPGFSVTDPDVSDTTHFYSIIAGDSVGLWFIHTTSGVISSAVVYDIDKNKHPSSVTLVVRVTDLGGKTDFANVRISITDVNDQKPIFTQASFVFPVTNCTPVGSEVGRILAVDADSSTDNNNFVVYEVKSDAYIQVHANGIVYLKSEPPFGVTLPLLVAATDQSTNGSPLPSPWKTHVSLRVSPCTGATASCGNKGRTGSGGGNSRSGTNSSVSSTNVWTQFAALVVILCSDRCVRRRYLGGYSIVH